MSYCRCPALHFLSLVAIMPADAQPAQDVVAAVENHYRDLTDSRRRSVRRMFSNPSARLRNMRERCSSRSRAGSGSSIRTDSLFSSTQGRAVLFKKSEQVIKKTFTDFEHMNIPVAFLLGAAHIRDDFDALQADPKTPRMLELLPRKPGAAMKKMRLVVDGEGRISDLVIFDRSGNTTTITFTDITKRGCRRPALCF